MRKTKKSHGFARFMWLYSLLFLAVLTVGLRYGWGYLEGYEQSTPERFIETYQQQISRDDVIAMAQGFLDSMDPVLTDRSAAEQLVADAIGTDLQCVWKKSDNGIETYALVRGGYKVGEMRISRTGETDSYGFRAWEFLDGSVSAPEVLTQSEMTVPAGYTLKVNGNPIGSSYVTETGIHYDFLEEYYGSYPDLPVKSVYTFTNYAGPLNVVMYDRNGNVAVVDETAGDIQFIEPLSAQEDSALNSFAQDFLEKYFKYTSGIGSLQTSYNALAKYLIPDSELVARLKAAEDGLNWAHTTTIHLDSYTINTAIKAGDDALLVNLMAVETVTREYQTGSETYNIGMKLLLTGNAADGYKVATLELY